MWFPVTISNLFSLVDAGNQTMFDRKQDALWRRYQDAEREIRANFNTIVEEGIDRGVL